jgi:AcrR family transcriptional regulator
MDLIMESAMQLLLTHRPEELTIRQITASAGLHHRYIPDYFGGKAELLAAIYGQVAQEAADAVTFPFAAGGIDPNIIRMARLAVWLSANHPDGVPSTERPLRKKILPLLREQFGLDEDVADLIFERLIASVLVLAAFPDVLGPDPIDVKKHVELEVSLLTIAGASTREIS